MITLTKRQQEAFDILQKNNKVFVHWDTGVGKTLFAVYAMKAYWAEKNRCVHTVFITKVGTFPAVRDALKANGIDERYYRILDNTKDRRAFEKEDFSKPLIIVSYDIFKKQSYMKIPRGMNKHKHLIPSGLMVKFNPKFMVIDESHMIKNPKSQVGKACGAISYLNPDKIIMGSATPIATDERDMFNQIYCLDGGVRLGKTYYTFEQSYLKDLNIARQNMKGYFPKKVFREDKKAEFYSNIQDIYHIIKKETDENIILPKRLTGIVKVPLEKTQEKIYDNIKKRSLLAFTETKEKLKDKTITKQQFYTSTLSIMSALRQVCCGFVYQQEDLNTPFRKAMRVPTLKIKSLRNGISKIPFNEKFIIWSVYTESFEIITELLKDMGIGYVLVTGKVRGKKREQAVDDFKSNPSIRAFVSHPKAGGAGLNLQQAKYSFCFSKDYSLIDKVQSEGRNYRVGSIKFNKEVIEIDLQTKGTIEDEISVNIKKKKDLISEFEKHLTANNNQYSL